MPHPYRSCRTWRFLVSLALTVMVAFVMIIPTAFAQLSKEDIDKLREEGQSEGWTFTVGENEATQYPLEQITGLVIPDNWQENARFDPCTPTKDLPASFDWREITGCPPIRNQGPCGSCWAFSTAGAFECNIRVKDGEDVDLSEQWLVSCNQSGWGCDGGWMAHDYYLDKNDRCGEFGAVLESHFPYTASDQYCDCPYPHSYFLESWAFIGEDEYSPPSNDAMKQAIMDHGPISIALYVGSGFHAYTGGVFNGCGSGTVNHAVVLVGWDDNQGLEGVWFLRNSWGPNWGEDGYMRVKYNCLDFGTAASYVEYHRAQKIAIIDNEMIDNAGGDGDNIPEAGETVEMVLSFENRFIAEATDVTANLFFDDASLNVTQPTAFLGTIQPDDTVTNAGTPFVFEIPADYIPRVDSIFVEFIWDGGAKVDTQSVERIIGGIPILVVDDDGGGDVEKYYLKYLDDMRVPYDISGGSGLNKSGIPNITSYPIVFWFTGDYRPDPISRLSIESIKEFCDGGGKLFLSGQHIAGQLSTYDPTFLADYLKADYLSSTYIPVIGYRAGGQVMLPGDSVALIGGEGADNQVVTDQVAAINGGVPEMGYINNPGLGALSYDGDYRLLFMTFGFEGIVNGSYRWTYRDSIFTRIIDFFELQTPDEGPQVSGLAVIGNATHITDQNPVFTWNYSDPAAKPQQMYQIQVTDDKFWMMAPVWDSGPVSSSQANSVYAGEELADGIDYFIRVRVFNGTLWSTWDYDIMHMNSVPVPTGLSPDNMQGINGDHPELTHAYPDDQENDSLTFVYELYDDSTMTTLLFGAKDGQSVKAGMAVWQVPMVLTVEEDYYWRVKASDPYESGEWSDLASFWVMGFVYGDANGDETVNVGDAVYLISYVFKGGPPPVPLEAGDANCDGECNVGDAVYLISYVFKGGPEPGCR